MSTQESGTSGKRHITSSALYFYLGIVDTCKNLKGYMKANNGFMLI
jgi:hypothetical protein